VRARRSMAVSLAAGLALGSAAAAPAKDLKTKTDASIARRQADLIGLSDRIWAYAETALAETRSAAALADYAEAQGLTVRRGVAGMPTAFVASYGEGRPILGILGEYDALPGLSQKATPVQEPLQPGAPGHGCGHNLLGTASLGAALAIKDLIASGAVKGTIRFYGTPAEEAVGGKTYMARDGLFDDLDLCLAWHPSDRIKADLESTQAIVDLQVDFRGKAAHAAYDPWNGRSALDALELFTHGVNLMREHVKPTSRLHYVITDGGGVPNVVPDHASLSLWVRDWERSEVDGLLRRLGDAATGAATMAGGEATVTVEGGSWEMLVNEAGAQVLQSNLERLGPLAFTEEEQEFARAIQRATGVEPTGLSGQIQPFQRQEPEGGSTDVGDVSWIVPTLHLSVTTAPVRAPWHAWPVTATGGMSIGHKGLVYAARALAGTLVDFYRDAGALSRVRAEFEKKTAGTTYDAYIPDGPPAPPE
jgi:aminobenzoyl-glutamate utilization protein B